MKDYEQYEREQEDTNPVWDVDDARYLGNGEDGVYYIALHDPATGKWFADSMVDCDSSGFCDQLVMLGPFDTEDAAWQAGKGAAFDWCVDNDVSIED